MAISLGPADPLDPQREVAGASLAELLVQLAEAVAEGQARLDLASAAVAESLAATTVRTIPSIRQVIAADGSVHYEQAEPVEVSLLALGVQPTFFAFAEATAEIALDLQVHESSTEQGTTQKPRLFGATQSLKTERRLNRDVSVHSKLTAKLVPVPMPAGLGVARSVEDLRKGDGP